MTIAPVILVTGAARRVGAEIARSLHAAGACVAIHYRSSAAEAAALVATLDAQRPGSTEIFAADLLDMAALPRLVESVVARFGRLDALVNNASSFHATRVGAVDTAAWDDLIGSNLKAPLFLAQAAAPHLLRSGGCIVNITDIHADRPMKSYVVYSVAKGGLLALTRSLARELGPEVRVNGVAPGTILWPEDSNWSDEISRQRVINQTALKRMAAQTANFARYAMPRAVLLTTEPWTVENALMTPTLKLKRNNLMKRFAQEIEAMYQPQARRNSGSA